MLLVSFVALSVLAGPADRLPEIAPPSSSAQARLAQDEFGDPPPPPPPVAEDLEAAPPPPPPPLDLEEPAAPPAPAKKKRPSRGDDDEGGADDGDPGFFEKYFPFTLDEPLHPAIDESLWAFWLVQIVPVVVAPQAWLTPMLIEGEPPEDYVVDALIIYFTHLLPHVCLYGAALPCLVIPYVNILALPCIGGCFLINSLACAANAWYLMPVAFANRLNDGFVGDEGSAADATGWLEGGQERDLAMAY